MHPQRPLQSQPRPPTPPAGVVVAVHTSPTHTFSKANRPHIRLLAGLGVEGDAHHGVTVKHRSRVAADPTRPNLRQVHLLHAELFQDLQTRGFRVAPGQIGENVTTSGLDLLHLPVGTRLHLGPDAIVELTGLRNPCTQLDRFQPGLMAAVLDHDEHGSLIRKAGVMAVVLSGGTVSPGHTIQVHLPPQPHHPLGPV
jgi:MOSC domain-containing protein YiiM